MAGLGCTAEYKRGHGSRERKFFLREDNGTFYFEKITKACGFTLIAGTEDEVSEYIRENGFKLVRVIG